MKKMMMILVSAIMMSASSFAAEKETTNVEPFEGVYVNAPVRVRFVYGEEYKVDVQSADSLAASAIRTSVKDGVLKIRSIDADEALNNVCVTIMSPVEPRLMVSRNMDVKNSERNYRAFASK